MSDDFTSTADDDLAILLEMLASVTSQPLPVAKDAQPLFGWQGGKRWLVKELLPLSPPHKMYVELFCGGGALLCAKPKSSAEVINDKNSELVNLYRIVKYHLPALFTELDWCINSREEFNASRRRCRGRRRPRARRRSSGGGRCRGRSS